MGKPYPCQELRHQAGLGLMGFGFRALLVLGLGV